MKSSSFLLEGSRGVSSILKESSFRHKDDEEIESKTIHIGIIFATKIV